MDGETTAEVLDPARTRGHCFIECRGSLAFTMALEWERCWPGSSSAEGQVLPQSECMMSAATKERARGGRRDGGA